MLSLPVSKAEGISLLILNCINLIYFKFENNIKSFITELTPLLPFYFLLNVGYNTSELSTESFK